MYSCVLFLILSYFYDDGLSVSRASAYTCVCLYQIALIYRMSKAVSLVRDPL